MAEYGYSTPYRSTNVAPLPPGYMEAATAPGRNLAAGIAQLGAGIGQAIQRYQTSKAENEAATQTFETLSGMAQQALASDPSYQALQNYYETGQLPQGVTEADLQRFSKKAEADRSMLNRMVGLGEKFGDMSVAKKKAAIGDMAMVLQQYQQRGEQETTRALREAQLAQAQIAVGQARAEELGQKQLSDALRAAYGVQAGQAPAVPFRSVTSELLSRYGNLTPAQQAQVAGIAEQRAATPPAGMVPMEATVRTPAGGTVTYGKPVDTTVTSQPIPGTNMVQTMIGGKPVGSPVRAEQSGDVANSYMQLPDNLQKVADNLAKDFGNEKAMQNVSVAGGFLNQINTLSADIGTPRYKPSDDIALIFSFMKTLDPGSTVREGEFATASNAGGIPEQVVNTYNKALNGKFLTDEQRKNFVDTSRKNFVGLEKEAKRVAVRFQKLAKDRGIPEFLVVPEGTFGAESPQRAGGQPAEERKTTGGVNYTVKRN
jgi:hypothetical protein